MTEVKRKEPVRRYHVEIIPPKQDSLKLEEDLELFSSKFERVTESGFTASITDNAMGLLAFQGHECIEELGLCARPGQVLIHLNTFHTKKDLDVILTSCERLGIFSVLAISGDGSPRLPKLKPADVEAKGTASVTSVELTRYIKKHYPEFTVGVAFNPYEPEEHEFEKLKRKLDAGASFVITQPIIDKNAVVDRLIEKYPDLPVTVEAWMSKKLYLLSDVVGYPIPEDTAFDPIDTLNRLQTIYPDCGFYLSLLGFKTQYQIIEEMAAKKKGGGGMRIVVCVKQVPATTDAKIDPETKRIIREGTKAILNPFDLYAVEEAVQIKEQYGGEVIVLSMGPESAKNVLTEALSMGADNAVLLCDRAFAGSDTWATSYALAKAIETIGSVDLILCGKQAVDGDTAQVGPGIASKLDIMQAANVSDINEIKDGAVTVTRLNENGYDVLRLRLPALLTVLKDINVPRIPTLQNARKARKVDITVWHPDDIGADPELIGLAASPTRVVKTEPPAVRNTVTLNITGKPEEAAKALSAELFSRGIL